MDRFIAADEWNGMSDSQRIDYCKIMANRAFASSKGAPPDIAEQYLRLSEYWLWLAHAIGRVRTE